MSKTACVTYSYRTRTGGSIVTALRVLKLGHPPQSAETPMELRVVVVSSGAGADKSDDGSIWVSRHSGCRLDSGHLALPEGPGP
eukprot:scaffold576677_cov38-Prasinocladus_malaysianus.AAC.1